MKIYKIRASTLLNFEFTLKAIYGERIYHGFSPSRFRSECRRIIKTIKRAINLNIETDGFHRSRLEFAINDLESSLKDKDFELGYIIGLIKLIFLLLGDMPNNWRRKKTSQASSFTLDSHRRIVYLQNLRQKVNTIFTAHEYEPYSKVLPRHDLLRTFMSENNNEWGLEKFIDWYKEKYSKLYLQLF